jgi:hypothetical protein
MCFDFVFFYITGSGGNETARASYYSFFLSFSKKIGSQLPVFWEVEHVKWATFSSRSNFKFEAPALPFSFPGTGTGAAITTTAASSSLDPLPGRRLAMKLKINKACDLSSISVLPPRSVNSFPLSPLAFWILTCAGFPMLLQ